MKKECPKCGAILRVVTQHPAIGWHKGKRQPYMRILYACDICGARISSH
jgi:hypothetical protein